VNEKYNIIPTLQFQKDIEYYYRKKKYKNIEEDIDSILEKLENGVFVGDEIQNIRFHKMKMYIKLELLILV